MINKIAWAAGVIEGEGCFSIFTKKNRRTPQCAIHLEMTDEDIIQRVREVFNVGSVCQRKRKDSRRKPSWCWSVQNKEGVVYVLDQILPYLGKRRSQKAMEVLETCK